MIKSYVIDLDTDDDFVRVFEVSREFTPLGAGKGVAYYRDSNADAAFNQFGVNAKFFGKLDALLVTKAKIEAAPPIEPEKVDSK